MNHLYGISLRLSILLFLSAGACAQSDVYSSLRTQAAAWRSTILQEKLFVHTDKTFYLAGEICWYKLYCVEGDTHVPLDLSKVAYLELLDRENRPVLQGKVFLDKGEGLGSFSLPLSLNPGRYTLRAYTNWMKNLGPGSFFEQPITIVNSFKRLAVSAVADSAIGSPMRSDTLDRHSAGASLSTATSGSATASRSATGAGPAGMPAAIGFFPEGGNLVNGIVSRVGFQLTNAKGRGVDGRGWVLDERNDTLVGFQPWKFGLGNFAFTPVAGHRYRAVIILPGGAILEKALPAAYDQGYVMRVDDLGQGSLDIRVQVSKGRGGGDIFLFVRAGRSSDIIRKAVLVDDSAHFILDKALLGEGVNLLTLLDGGGRPLCERVYAIPPRQVMQIDAGVDQGEYGTRRKVKVSVAAKGGEGQWLSASLSMAVYREDPLQSAEGMDIYSYLWLGADLKGRIESPEYYLSGEGAGSVVAWDNLLLTHGWRRFHWTDMTQQMANPSLLPPERRGQLIMGRLTNMHTGTPVRGVFVYLTVPGVRFQFAPARTDRTGRFCFDIKDFYGTGGILLETNTPKDSVYKIEIASPYSEQYSGEPAPVFPLTDSLENVALAPSILEHSLSMQVQNVYLADSLKKFRVPVMDSLHFFGRPDYSYKLDDYTRFTTIEEVLREYVREINVNRLHGRLHVLMLNEPVRQFFEDNNTLVLLDGIPVMDDNIFAYDPLKVYKLEVIPRMYVAGPCSFSGIASFTTYKGDYDGLELDNRSLLLDYDGLQPRREFYAPAYDSEQQVASRLPDYRDLLYWSPDVHTDGNGPKEYSFYTSDLPGRYVVVIQGITTDGQAGVKYLHFNVK